MRGAAAFVDRRRRTTHKCYDLYSTVEMLTTRDGPAVIDAKARYWLKMAIFAPVMRFPSEYCHDFWYEKMVWLPDGEKFLFLSTEYTNVSDRWTDRQTDTARRHRPRLRVASRGKNV